jgi:hypothetical protein
VRGLESIESSAREGSYDVLLAARRLALRDCEKVAPEDGGRFLAGDWGTYVDGDRGEYDIVEERLRWDGLLGDVAAAEGEAGEGL